MASNHMPMLAVLSKLIPPHVSYGQCTKVCSCGRDEMWTFLQQIDVVAPNNVWTRSRVVFIQGLGGCVVSSIKLV